MGNACDCLPSSSFLIIQVFAKRGILVKLSDFSANENSLWFAQVRKFFPQICKSSPVSVYFFDEIFLEIQYELSGHNIFSLSSEAGCTTFFIFGTFSTRSGHFSYS